MPSCPINFHFDFNWITKKFHKLTEEKYLNFGIFFAKWTLIGSVWGIDFICAKTKYCACDAKPTMPIVKCTHKCRNSRISVAITLVTPASAAATPTTACTPTIITIMSSVSIEIQTKANPLIRQIASYHCIRIRTISQTSMYRFMFDKQINTINYRQPVATTISDIRIT